MLFLSFRFYAAVLVLLLIYYCVPPKARWMVLLTGSLGIYVCFSGWGIFLLLFSVIVSYGVGRALERLEKKWGKLVLACGIIAVSLPLLLTKVGRRGETDWLSVMGISYFTLQVIAYMVDVWRGKVRAEKNPAKYALFVTFFPQIVQGPIARYGQLGQQFFGGKRLDEKLFVKGFQWILWGFFLKLMIADRAGAVVDTVFGEWRIYTGSYVLLGGILYSIQLYADFMACVFLAKGIAAMFGITLADNFNRPYFSDNMKEFWARWHISLSSWLKDYIYIPLGGSREGKIRKWVNLILVFVVSGIWHGSGLRYIAWGLMHAGYQIAGEMTLGIRKGLYRMFRIPEDSFLAELLRKGTTLFLVMLAWIVFRAESLRTALKMLRSLFTVYNPWVLFDDSIFSLGLDMKEWMLLVLAVLALVAVSLQQRKTEVGEWLLRQHLLLRWTVYIAAILLIVVYGAYGAGFDAQAFIYGGF